jgi:hypothetical protein
MAKYILSWTLRLGGSARQNHEDIKASLAAFSKWEVPSDQDILQFLVRVDNHGGYAIVETDNPAGLMDASSKFMTWLDFELVPVVDVADGVTQIAAGVEFRDSI